MATEQQPDMSPRPDASPLISSADGKKKKKGIGRLISKLKRSSSSRHKNGSDPNSPNSIGDESSSRRSSVEIADYQNLGDDHDNDKFSSAPNHKDSSSNKKDEIVEKLLKPAPNQQTSENGKSSTPAAGAAILTNVAGAVKEEVLLSQEAVPRKDSAPKVEKEKPSSQPTPVAVISSDRQIHNNVTQQQQEDKPPPTDDEQATATDTLASTELPHPEDNCVTSLAKGLQQICSGGKKEPAAADH